MFLRTLRSLKIRLFLEHENGCYSGLSRGMVVLGHSWVKQNNLQLLPLTRSFAGGWGSPIYLNFSLFSMKDRQRMGSCCRLVFQRQNTEVSRAGICTDERGINTRMKNMRIRVKTHSTTLFLRPCPCVASRLRREWATGQGGGRSASKGGVSSL
jgi:hypothetical protein